jgi:hypothetical protein
MLLLLLMSLMLLMLLLSLLLLMSLRKEGVVNVFMVTIAPADGKA